jgi:hypothetical protein
LLDCVWFIVNCFNLINITVCRGRYSVGMYRQMQYTDLVARNQAIFVDMAVRMAEDDEFRHAQSKSIAEKYNSVHQNHLAALEWLEFLDRAIKQQL